MPANESLIQHLLEEILESGLSPQEACREHPDLIAEVTVRLERARALETHIDAVFPVGEPRSERRTIRRLATKLPQIPGYHVEGVVGTGGTGVVYRARHLKLNRIVAIKMLLAGGYAGADELERFKREAESIAGLCHPNIVQVFDAGECDGHPYFIMEFMEGGSLAAHLDGRPRPPAEAATLITTLARAVHAAHSGGIMHRDLKPANILLTADGTLKIADFGLARRSGQADPGTTLTLAGARMGTPSYMSPEQASGTAAGFCPLIDIYALGAILYEMLTGRPPFRGENPAETERQVLADEPVPPARLNPRVPRDLQTICLKCLQKSPAKRYDNAADLADDIERLMRGDPIRARPVGAFERTVKWCRRRPAAASFIAIVVVATAAAITGGLWLHRLEDARQTERLVRQQGARSAVESALPLLETLGRSRQWTEAAGILGAARTRLADADSRELESRLSDAAQNIEVAQELDRIRQSFPEPSEIGYSFSLAHDAYAQVFDRIGLGRNVDVQTAAARVRASPLRDLLLTALDNAAFTEIFEVGDTERRRLLDIARTADPNPWQDRFRDGTAWQNLSSLLQLVKDSRTATPPPTNHQLVILSLLVANLGANDITIGLLRDAQLRDPTDFWVNLELGNALERAGQRIEALQFFRTAVSLRPSHHVAWTTLASLLIFNKTPEEAIAPLRKAIQIQPAFAGSWKLLITALADCDRWDEAHAVALDAIAANPDDADLRGSDSWLHLRRARVAVDRRRWADALPYYSLAISKRYNNDSEVWFEQTALLLLVGQRAEYERACSTLLDRSDHAAMRAFLTMRACTLAPLPVDQRSRATQVAEKEVMQYASDHWSLTVRGAMLCRDNRQEDAINLLKQSIAADPKPENAILNWLWLAYAHTTLGQPESARPWFENAARWLDQNAKVRPDSMHLHNWLEAHILRHEVESMLAP